MLRSWPIISGQNKSVQYITDLLLLLPFVSAGGKTYSCFQIDYFPNATEVYTADDSDSTNAIPCKFESPLLSRMEPRKWGNTEYEECVPTCRLLTTPTFSPDFC